MVNSRWLVLVAAGAASASAQDFDVVSGPLGLTP